ncbi:hypothetical protein Patl1_07096 [Pistacia atlantica]|uniref:Uncharacterized protein n=1 Tax=Pistacia atlantica TaxID=434234 RepID=A0ACC1AHU7_9ROSI|nr:hypothetical protein Patl1_07096 [Pistacia atlantica]
MLGLVKNTVIVSSILGGVSDNTGSGIARRLVIKAGLNVILACNIPKNSRMIEVNAEKNLVEKLISLGFFFLLRIYFHQHHNCRDHKIYIRCTTNALHCQNTIIFTTLKNAVEKYESGNLRLEATNVFNDASDGYLVEDSCVFVADVFVCKETITGEGECLSIIKDAPTLTVGFTLKSVMFLTHEKIPALSKGRSLGTGTFRSLYLALADLTTLAPGSKIYAPGSGAGQAHGW